MVKISLAFTVLSVWVCECSHAQNTCEYTALRVRPSAPLASYESIGVCYWCLRDSLSASHICPGTQTGVCMAVV